MSRRRTQGLAVGFASAVGACTLLGWSLAPVAHAVDTTISYSGETVVFSPPPGVCGITLGLAGADGGAVGDVQSLGTIVGGDGGRIQATLGLAPGDVVAITVGGVGAVLTPPTGRVASTVVAPAAAAGAGTAPVVAVRPRSMSTALRCSSPAEAAVRVVRAHSRTAGSAATPVPVAAPRAASGSRRQSSRTKVRVAGAGTLAAFGAPGAAFLQGTAGSPGPSPDGGGGGAGSATDAGGGGGGGGGYFGGGGGGGGADNRSGGGGGGGSSFATTRVAGIGSGSAHQDVDGNGEALLTAVRSDCPPPVVPLTPDTPGSTTAATPVAAPRRASPGDLRQRSSSVIATVWSARTAARSTPASFGVPVNQNG